MKNSMFWITIVCTLVAGYFICCILSPTVEVNGGGIDGWRPVLVFLALPGLYGASDRGFWEAKAMIKELKESFHW